MNKQNKNKAFTIIEVVLVLAVAGLIFLVVFAAIPRLQASRRDNQRKRDADTLFTAIIDFQSNVGRLPTGAACTTGEVNSAFASSPSGAFVDYIPENLESPEGGDYQYPVQSWANFWLTDSNIIYCEGRECTADSTNAQPYAGVGATDFALLMSLERGIYCIDTT